MSVKLKHGSFYRAVVHFDRDTLVLEKVTEGTVYALRSAMRHSEFLELEEHNRLVLINGANISNVEVTNYNLYMEA